MPPITVDMPPRAPVRHPSGPTRTDAGSGPADSGAAADGGGHDVPATSAQRGRRPWVWVAVALVVALAGAGCSWWAAGTVAQKNVDSSRHTFAAEAADVTSTLHLAIQHEQDLLVSAAGFFARGPQASNAHLALWADTTQAHQRYPELVALGEVVAVPAAKLPAFTAQLRADPPQAADAGQPFALIPPGPRSEYCLTRAGLSWSTTLALPAGYDFCTGLFAAATQAARDSGDGAYLPLQLGGVTYLAVMTPVYEPGAVQSTVTARRAAFLGWVGTVIQPGAVLATALGGHSSDAVTLSYHSGVSNAVFRAGSMPTGPGARSITTTLGGGWAAQTFGRVTPGGIAADPAARQLLGAGLALSLTLAALLLVLATTRMRALALVRQRTRELQHQALHDALTDLPNRVLILDRIGQLLARSRRNGTRCAAFCLDLDGFKTINDTLGHATGDLLLQAVAARMTHSLPDIDTIGRMGGDEFVILLDAKTHPGGPEIVAEHLLGVIRQPFEIDGVLNPIVITASIGIAVGNDQTPGELLREADTALYQAKGNGKNGQAQFRTQMSIDLARRYELEIKLRAALDHDQFQVHYQPIYELGDLNIVGVEALLRWHHPSLGALPPDVFIPILEDNGQIVALGRWVLQHACTQVAEWRASGHELHLAVNVSARQLERDAIIDDVREVLRTTGLPAHALTVEVTETALMSDIDATARRLTRLKALGIRIAIDDFGTGYSSLAYLQRLPADSLKIDRAFIAAIGESRQSDALVNTFIELGQTLNMTTLAEGVETTDQLDYLRARQVDQMQGFLLSRPLDAETFERRLLGLVGSSDPGDGAQQGRPSRSASLPRAAATPTNWHPTLTLVRPPG